MTQEITTNTDIKDYTNLQISNSVANFTAENKNFSKLIDNINTKTKEVETKFVSQAVKSNTSSINKAANAKTDKKVTDDQTVDKKSIVQTKKTAQEIQKRTKIETKSANAKTAENKVDLSKNKTTNTNTSSKDKLSDINNSSPVETSPVFSSKETEETTIQENKITLNNRQTEENEAVDILDITESIPQIANITISIDTQQETNNLKSEIQDFVNSLEISKETISTIESIASTLSENDFSNENQEHLQALVEKLKSILSNNQEKDEVKFDSNIKTVEVKSDLNKETLKEIKSEIKEILTNISQELETMKNSFKDAIENIKENPKIQEAINNVLNSVEKTDIKAEIEPLKETIKKVLDVLKENTNENKTSELKTDKVKVDLTIKNEIQSAETKVDLDKIKENIDEIISKVSKINVEKDENTDINDILNSLKEIKSEINKVEKNQNVNLTVDKNETFKNSTEETKIDNAPLKEVSLKPMEDQQTTVSSTKEEKVISQITEILKEANSKTDDKTIDKAIQTISLKDSTKEVEIKEDSTIKIKDELISDEEIIDTKQFEGNSDNQNDFQDTSKNQTEIKATVQNTIQEPKETESKNINLEEVFSDDNLSILEDIAFSSNLSEAGALTAVDEVTKLAITETNAVKEVDSAINSQNNIIKNISFEKTLQNSIKLDAKVEAKMDSNNVLNQITQKLQSIQNGSGQKLTMVLRPNDLGRLSIELITNEKGLTTNILAQNEDVRKYIEKNINALRQQLSDAGVNVNSIQIKTAGQTGNSTYEGNQGFNQQNQNNNENFNNQNGHKSNQNNKNKEEFFSNKTYDTHQTKDFSTVLTNTFNYSLS